LAEIQPAPPPRDSLIDSVVADRYRVIKLLGEGGMGQVYLAEHIAIERRIALKVLRAEYAHRGEMVSRFQQEAISASRIKHPNVLDVFDFGRLENGCFFLAMEFLDGNDLAEEMARRRVIEPTMGVRIALEVCRGLQAAHSKGVVHRDLKPENVFLQRTQEGEEAVKIVDFGIAQLRSNEDAAGSQRRRLTRTGMIFGTPEYMAPEQAAGRRADHRTDVYALGILMYEMFTGSVPFTDETFLGVLSKHASETPPAMSAILPELAISPQLQSVVMKALAKNPDERYESMTEFAQAIQGTPEGMLYAHKVLGRPQATERSPEFMAPAAGNPTAPEFGVVQGPPQVVLPDPNRGARTVPHGTARNYPSRAQTLPSGPPVYESSMPPPTAGGEHKRLGLWVGVGAVLVAGAVGAFVIGNRRPPANDVPSSAPMVSAPPPKPTTEVKPLETAVAPSVTTDASAQLPSTSAGVKLEVTTDPPGATLTKNGFQVCDATPCDVIADLNETLELEAAKGALKGKTRVLAQRDQKVTMKLVGKGKPPKRLCEVEVDGLKILRPCN
jgi:serine/threonine protein kinase